MPVIGQSYLFLKLDGSDVDVVAKFVDFGKRYGSEIKLIGKSVFVQIFLGTDPSTGSTSDRGPPWWSADGMRWPRPSAIPTCRAGHTT